MKPFDFNRFLVACNKVSEAINLKNNKHDHIISIKSDSKIFNLKESQISHIESKDDYVKIYFLDGKYLLCKITTKGILEILSTNFIRVHRSFIINKNYVKYISTATLNCNGVELPIGKNFKIELSKIFNEQE